MTTIPTLQPATNADRVAVVTLLNALHLPTVDLPASLDNFVIATYADAVIGTCGVELYGPIALLRSLAVAADWRGQGLGIALYRAALTLAKKKEVKQVFLITNTAATFFENLGFTKVERAAVPAAIQQTAQFSSVCPASAAILCQEIS